MSRDLPLTPEDVADIVAILDGTQYERLDVKTSRFTLRVARSGEGWTQDWDWTADAQAPAAAIAVDAATEPAGAGDVEGLTSIRPPLPGTFYRAPQPGAPVFVEVGDRVTEETVIGIVETMKLMNPAHAGCAGTIEAILVENGTLIGGDAVLMRVRPD